MSRNKKDPALLAVHLFQFKANEQEAQMIKQFKSRLGAHHTTETVLTAVKGYSEMLDKLDKIKTTLDKLNNNEIFIKNEKGEFERIFIIQL